MTHGFLAYLVFRDGLYYFVVDQQAINILDIFIRKGFKQVAPL